MSRIPYVLVLIIACIPSFAADWGLTAEFAALSRSQSSYEAPVLAERGVNCIFLSTIRTNRTLSDWIGTEAEMHASRIRCFWDLPIKAADSGVSIGPSNVSPTLPGFFSPEFAYGTRITAKAIASRLRTPVGYALSPDPKPDCKSDAARKSWQQFLKAFFRDNSPGEDTNGDGSTFNTAFQTGYPAWPSVPLFDEKSLIDHKLRLTNMWLADSRAACADGICETLLTEVSRKAVVGSRADSPADASFLAARKNINTIYTSYPDSLPAINCAAAAFGKSLFARSISLVAGDLASSEQRALRVLPYANGITFDYAGLVKSRASGTPARITTFSPAFQVIPELAPFAGKFEIKRANVLWILPDDAPSANILDAYCISESALALDPDCIDLNRFKAVIYRSSSPCISLEILQKLFTYGLKGGVVFLDAWNVASGPTLHGRENRRFWWQGMKLARDSRSEGTTTVAYNDQKQTIPGVFPYLVGDGDMMSQAGKVEDSTGASYPLIFVRKLGTSGKWVFINIPDIWESHFPLIRSIVRDQSGIDLPDPSEPRVYSGPNSILAIGGNEPRAITIKCDWEDAAVFDIFSRQGWVVSANNGRIQLPETLEPHKAKLWIIKPYRQPVVLYTDGTIDHAASINNGDYASKTLTFRFADTAYVSSPTKPQSLNIGGREAPFTYDAERHLVTIKGTGQKIDARLIYAE